MRRLVVLVLAACGSSPPPGLDASLDDLAIGCMQQMHPAQFATSNDFAPAVRGTLAGWNPDGRWFLTGARISIDSSFHFRRNGESVVVNRDPAALGTMNDTEIFQRVETIDDEGNHYVDAIRVSNLRPDGTARAERAACVNVDCTVCTAQLVRATHNAGEGEADHLALLGQLADPHWGPGSTFNVRIAGTLAYLIRSDGLHIIDTADPARPVELGHYQRTTPGYSNDLKLVEAGAKRFALIADSPVDIVDVTTPAAPALVAQIPEDAHTLFTETRDGTTRAYFGNYDGKCPVYDVTNPTLPRKLGSYATGATIVHDMSVANGIAYLNAWERGFLVIDFTTPQTPGLLASWRPTPTHTSHSNWTTTAGGRDIALHGEEAYDAHLDIVDLDRGSPTFMKPLASWQTRPWVSIHNIMAFGTKAYLTYYQDGVRVLDVSNPAHPSQLGYYNTWDPQAEYTSSYFFEGAVGLDVDLARKLIFVADSPRGLLILRDDTP